MQRDSSYIVGWIRHVCIDIVYVKHNVHMCVDMWHILCTPRVWVSHLDLWVHVVQCMYARTYACMHVRRYACMHACMHVCLHACTSHIYMYICIYIYIYMYTQIYIYIYVHTYMYIYMYNIYNVCTWVHVVRRGRTSITDGIETPDLDPGNSVNWCL